MDDLLNKIDKAIELANDYDKSDDEQFIIIILIFIKLNYEIFIIFQF